jgi:hypothetical protein
MFRLCPVLVIDIQGRSEYKFIRYKEERERIIGGR